MNCTSPSPTFSTTLIPALMAGDGGWGRRVLFCIKEFGPCSDNVVTRLSTSMAPPIHHHTIPSKYTYRSGNQIKSCLCFSGFSTFRTKYKYFTVVKCQIVQYFISFSKSSTTDWLNSTVLRLLLYFNTKHRLGSCKNADAQAANAGLNKSKTLDTGAKQTGLQLLLETGNTEQHPSPCWNTQSTG